mmetsp:Transcript_17598/g.20403  ORF Transcript_17598/g.20403 Transcript_17598/m.20403 type:complete len:215 (-) Transcript_17598:1476-2120(-)
MRLHSAIAIPGVAHSGQASIHSALCQTADVNCLLYYEALQPPAPEHLEPTKIGSDQDSRVPLAYHAMSVLKWLRPLYHDMFSIHPSMPFDESLLSSYIFSSLGYQVKYGHLPTYDSWLSTTDHEPMYRFIKRCFQILQWQREPSATHHRRKRWVLASPQTLEHVEIIRRVFPRAHFIFCHRNSVEAYTAFVNIAAYTGRYISFFWVLISTFSCT